MNHNLVNLLFDHLALSIATILMLIFIPTVGATAVPASFNLLDASEWGAFNIGLAIGGVSTTFDENLERDILKFEYMANSKTMVGVWTKGYPAGLKADAVDSIRIGVKVPNSKLLNQISVKVEIKGKKSWQSISLDLKPGWNFTREPINWNKIGELNEVVFVVSAISEDEIISPIGGGEILSPGGNGEMSGQNDGVKIISLNSGGELKGTLYFLLDFYKMTFLQKHFIFVKIGLIFVVSLFFAFISASFSKLFKRYRV